MAGHDRPEKVLSGPCKAASFIPDVWSISPLPSSPSELDIIITTGGITVIITDDHTERVLGYADPRPQKDRLDLLRSMLSANRWLSQVKDIRMSRCANRACDSE